MTPERPTHCQATGRPEPHPQLRDRTTIMALQTSMSIGELKKRNDQSQQKQDTEKASGSTPKKG